MELRGSRESSLNTGLPKDKDKLNSGRMPRELCLGQIIEALPKNLEDCLPSQASLSRRQAKQEELPDLSQLRITEVALKKSSAYRQSCQDVKSNNSNNASCAPHPPPLEFILRRVLRSQHRRSKSQFVSCSRNTDLQGNLRGGLGFGAMNSRKKSQCLGPISWNRGSSTDFKLKSVAGKTASKNRNVDGSRRSFCTASRQPAAQAPRRSVQLMPKPERRSKHLALPRIIVS